MSAPPSEDVERGPRCLCGHYKIEHYWNSVRPRCRGGYATLTVGEDNLESVEVHCSCDNFYPVVPGFHEVRRLP